MRCETTTDARAFWARVSGLLLGDPLVNSVLLTNVASRRDGAVVDPAPPTFAAVLDDADTPVGATMRTPPFGIALSAMPAVAVEPLVAAMATACPGAAGVGGPAARATAFAEMWTRLTGRAHDVERRVRLHRLEGPDRAANPAGRHVAAGRGRRSRPAGRVVGRVRAGGRAGRVGHRRPRDRPPPGRRDRVPVDRRRAPSAPSRRRRPSAESSAWARCTRRRRAAAGATAAR